MSQGESIAERIKRLQQQHTKKFLKKKEKIIVGKKVKDIVGGMEREMRRLALERNDLEKKLEVYMEDLVAAVLELDDLLEKATKSGKIAESEELKSQLKELYDTRDEYKEEKKERENAIEKLEKALSTLQNKPACLDEKEIELISKVFEGQQAKDEVARKEEILRKEKESSISKTEKKISDVKEEKEAVEEAIDEAGDDIVNFVEGHADPENREKIREKKNDIKGIKVNIADTKGKIAHNKKKEQDALEKKRKFLKVRKSLLENLKQSFDIIDKVHIKRVNNLKNNFVSLKSNVPSKGKYETWDFLEDEAKGRFEHELGRLMKDVHFIEGLSKVVTGFKYNSYRTDVRARIQSLEVMKFPKHLNEVVVNNCRDLNEKRVDIFEKCEELDRRIREIGKVSAELKKEIEVHILEANERQEKKEKRNKELGLMKGRVVSAKAEVQSILEKLNGKQKEGEEARLSAKKFLKAVCNARVQSDVEWCLELAEIQRSESMTTVELFRKELEVAEETFASLLLRIEKASQRSSDMSTLQRNVDDCVDQGYSLKSSAYYEKLNLTLQHFKGVRSFTGDMIKRDVVRKLEEEARKKKEEEDRKKEEARKKDLVEMNTTITNFISSLENLVKEAKELEGEAEGKYQSTKNEYDSCSQRIKMNYKSHWDALEPQRFGEVKKFSKDLSTQVTGGQSILKKVDQALTETRGDVKGLKSDVENFTGKKKLDDFDDRFGIQKTSVVSTVKELEAFKIMLGTAKEKEKREKEEDAADFGEEEAKKIQQAVQGSGNFTPNASGSQLTNLLQTIVERYVEYIKNLNLRKKSLEKEGIEGLGLILSNPSNVLEVLDLDSCGINDEKFKILADAILQNKNSLKIKRLDLSHNSLTKDSAVLIGRILITNKTLTYLHIGYNYQIGDVGFAHIIKSVIINNDSSLTDLNMTYTGNYEFKTADSCFNTNDIRNDIDTKMTRLDLFGCDIRNGNNFLSIVLSKLSKLLSLNLEYCSLTDVGLNHALFGLTELKDLSNFYLDSEYKYSNNNVITLPGMRAIKENQMKSKSKYKVYLNGQEGIGDAGVAEFISDRVDQNFRLMKLSNQCLPNLKKFYEGLKEEKPQVNLSKNLFTNSNGELCFLFELNDVRTVDLSFCKLNNNGAEQLIPSLKKNKTIGTIGFDRIGIVGSAIHITFWESLFSIPTLESVRLGGNDLGTTGMKNLVDAVLKNSNNEQGSKLKNCSFNFTSNMGFTKEMMDHLRRMCCGLDRVHLELDDCQLTDEMIFPFFCQVDEMKGSLNMYLKNNKISQMGVKTIMKMVSKRKEYSWINLRGDGCNFEGPTINQNDFLNPNQIDPELIEMVQVDDTHLDRVYLPENFHEQLRQESLKGKVFEISNYSLNIQDKGIKANTMRNVIDNLLQHNLEGVKSLKVINVSKNKIGDEGIDYVNKIILECKDLETINVSECGLTDTGLSKLVMVLNKCPKIKNIHFQGNEVGEESLKLLRKSNLL